MNSQQTNTRPQTRTDLPQKPEVYLQAQGRITLGEGFHGRGGAIVDPETCEIQSRVMSNDKWQGSNDGLHAAREGTTKRRRQPEWLQTYLPIQVPSNTNCNCDFT